MIDPLLQPLLRTFVLETESIVQRINRSVLALERAQGTPGELAEHMKTVARDLHTIKGTSATFELADASELAHRIEDLVLAKVRPDAPLSASVAEAILCGADALALRIRAHAEGRGGLLAPPSTVADLVERVAIGDKDALAELKRHGVEESLGIDEEQWRVSAGDVTRLMSEAERLRELRLRLEERASQVDRALSHLAGGASRENLERARVQLVATRSALGTDAAESASIVGSLEDGLRAVATAPVSTVVEPLHRMVRDHCRAAGKIAALSVVGGELSIDRRLLTSLRGPLAHLLRNAIDHGIETPEVRDAAGKHVEGALVLRIELEGSYLGLSVSDDGAGIDLDAVRATAAKRGLASPEELAGMSRAEVISLIFQPGFTTRADVSETSGRGVGLDAVATTVRSLRGHVDVTSREGSGTEVLLTVPAAIGSSPTLVILAAQQAFGLPMTSVENVAHAKRCRIETAGDRVLVEHAGELVPVKSLAALLHLREAEVPRGTQPILVVRSQQRLVGIAVDDVVTDRDLVIRPLPEELRGMRVYQGAATMARGEALLVLRPSWLVATEAAAVSRTSPRALVVDDSITARAMHRTMLESGGFVVHTAANAEQALGAVETSRYDVLITDLHMEGMGGIELIEALRASERTRTLPVVLVSVRDDDDVRVAATAAGADAFISKHACTTGRLLREVRAVMAQAGRK